MPDSKENKLPSSPPILNNAGLGEETTAAKDWDLSLSNTLSDQSKQWPQKKPLTHVVTDGSREQPESETAPHGFGSRRDPTVARLSLGPVSAS